MKNIPTEINQYVQAERENIRSIEMLMQDGNFEGLELLGSITLSTTPSAIMNQLFSGPPKYSIDTSKYPGEYTGPEEFEGPIVTALQSAAKFCPEGTEKFVVTKNPETTIDDPRLSAILCFYSDGK